MRRYSPFLLLLLIGCGSIRTQAVDPVADRLENTPRHDEWIQIRHGDRTLHAYVSYPQRSSLSPAILVIHENRGLNDWARSIADQLAERGYVAIAPDFLSGMAPGGGRTTDFPSEDSAREAISGLPPHQVMADMQAAIRWVRELVSTNDLVSVVGFCWGGARAWEIANANDDLTAVYVFYGTGPDAPAEVANITAPVYGFYGGDDARVNAGIPRTEELMRAAGLRFEPVIYEGAGHAYMRAGTLPDASPANREAMRRSWDRWTALLQARDPRR